MTRDVCRISIDRGIIGFSYHRFGLDTFLSFALLLGDVEGIMGNEESPDVVGRRNAQRALECAISGAR